MHNADMTSASSCAGLRLSPRNQGVVEDIIAPAEASGPLLGWAYVSTFYVTNSNCELIAKY